MKKKRSKISLLGVLRGMATTLHLLTLVPLWLTAWSGWISPLQFPLAGRLNMDFPIALVAAGATALLVVVLAPKRIWIPLLGLLPVVLAVRAYCPLNLTSPPPKQAIKLMTWNCMHYGAPASLQVGTQQVFQYVVRSDAEIALLQEASLPKKEAEALEALCRLKGWHVGKVEGEVGELCCLSKYRIARTEPLVRGSILHAAAFHLLLTPTDTLTLVGVHLENTNLSIEKRKQFSRIVHENMSWWERFMIYMNLAYQVSNSAPARSVQVDAVTAYIDSLTARAQAAQREPNIVVCGDFNDVPASYTHHEFSHRLTDVFVATGNGLGRSYNRYGIYTRIDHAFCSAQWKPFAASFDETQKLSDHYPLTFYLRRNRP